jgi:hypothetical protein
LDDFVVYQPVAALKKGSKSTFDRFTLGGVVRYRVFQGVGEGMGRSSGPRRSERQGQQEAYGCQADQGHEDQLVAAGHIEDKAGQGRADSPAHGIAEDDNAEKCALGVDTEQLGGDG